MNTKAINPADTRAIPTLDGDLPKLSIKDDDFGLDRIAAAIARLLANRVTADGYTIGVEGEWGSGKTSLTHFIIEALKEQSSLTLKIIRFEPWLVGNRQALLSDLFRGLRAKIEEFQADPLLKDKLIGANKNLIDRLTASLERYQILLEAVGKGAAVAATADPTLHTGVAAGLLSFLNWSAKKVIQRSKARTRTLEDLREIIKRDLRALAKLSPNTRFIVIIDDVDRLEPAESIEILRLIRAVADFPLVTYLVCYDRLHLACQIKEVIGVGDGYDYLKKIFQNIISLPPQEAFALRRHARKLLTQRFPEEFTLDSTLDTGQAAREAFFFDHWGGKFITTPRSAVRLAEAVTLGWPELKGRADFIDYVWLQLIKLECHDLYEWVRDYIVNVGAYRDGGRAGNEEPRQFAERLRKILEGADWSIERDEAGMHNFLPGLAQYVDAKKPLVFGLESRDLAKFEAGRRLGSPSHWRLYFAFDKPSYALDDDLLSTFRRAASVGNVDDAVAVARNLLARPHQHRGYYFGIFLERLFDARDGLSAKERVGIARILGNVMDEVPPPTGLIGELIDSWRRAETLLLPEAAPEFSQLCASGAAINWLAEVIRTQGFARGRPESQTYRGEPWLNDEQFQASLEAVLARVYALGIEGIIQRPKPITILYCWLQLGVEKALRDRVAIFTESDEGLLIFLEALRTWGASSNRGVLRILQSENVGHFMDNQSAQKRVQYLSINSQNDQLKKHALGLLDIWDWGRETQRDSRAVGEDL